MLGAARPVHGAARRGTACSIDFFIVNVALPTIDHDLHAGPALLELVVAGYGVAYAVLLVLGGRLGDMVGRRRLFLVGHGRLRPHLAGLRARSRRLDLVGARVAQGAAAALMLPQVLATIQAATAGTRRAGRSSLYGATAGSSMVAGPDARRRAGRRATSPARGWRSVFLVNVPVAVVGLVLAAGSVPETRSARPAPVDVPGTLLLALRWSTLLRR